jgi:hypothetical protein
VTAEAIVGRFEEAHEVETGEVRTHADAAFPYAIWFVRGFEGY